MTFGAIQDILRELYSIFLSLKMFNYCTLAFKKSIIIIHILLRLLFGLTFLDYYLLDISGKLASKV